MRATPEPSHARAGELSGRGFEVTSLDALDRLHHDRAASVQILGRQQPLAIILETGGPTHAEDVLAHPAPYPVLRVPQGEESGLEAEGLAFFIPPVLCCW